MFFLIREGTISGASDSRLHETLLEETIPAAKQCSPTVRRDKPFRKINNIMTGTSIEQVYIHLN